MAFVLKKSKPIRFSLGEDMPVLIVKKIKVQRVARLYAEHADAITAMQEAAKSADSEMVLLSKGNLDFLEEALDLTKEAVTGWENIEDEDGNPVPYSAEALDELVSSNFEFLTKMIEALNVASGMSDKAEAEKN